MANELVLLAQWRERLQRLSQSGMTVEAFCRQEGISTVSVHGFWENWYCAREGHRL